MENSSFAGASGACPAPGGAFAPAKFLDPAPGGAFAPAKFFDPAPGGAFAPAKFVDPAPGGAFAPAKSFDPALLPRTPEFLAIYLCSYQIICIKLDSNLIGNLGNQSGVCITVSYSLMAYECLKESLH